MSTPRRSILVVDDALDARLVMQAVLHKSGYEVRLAEDGDTALRTFRERPADLVMLDVDMPGRSGYEVCAELRAFAGPLLPIVMVTGLDDMASVQAAYDCGATDFIAKPINWPLIGHRLNYLFRAHETTLNLSAAESHMAAILDALPDPLVELDIEGRIIDVWMPGSASLAGFDGSVVGHNLVDVLPEQAASVCQAALRAARDEGTSNGHQFELPHEAGHSCFELSVSRKAGARGAKSHYLVLLRDISARKDAERRIAQLAYFDGLTGLSNRLSFLERVDQRIRHNAAHDEPLAVLFIDLDGFKNVNDTLGHKAGDQVLQAAADRLRASLRATDFLERVSDVPKVDLGRLGGDEFTVLLGEIARPQDAVSVARRLARAMRQPYEIEGRVVTLDSSIGVAIYPQDGEDGDTLLKHADTAMYQAKRAGRGNVELYSAELTERLNRRMALEASLRVALERDEFRLVYQPQVERVSGRVHAVEALLRWHHPDRGVVSPLDFIPLAEETDLIEHIGQWVLRTACADAATWLRAGKPMVVAVNLSAKQFRCASLPEQVLAALAESGLPAKLLEVEITESLLMDNTDTARSMLQVLCDHGVRTALDDFGTGYSSLAYLTRMPIGKIKIDREFVAGLLQGGDSAAIVRAVLAMADSLGMDVTAEGVETREQAQALVAMGCASLQGYYLGRPVPAADIPSFAGKCWRFDLLEPPATEAVSAGLPQQA